MICGGCFETTADNRVAAPHADRSGRDLDEPRSVSSSKATRNSSPPKDRSAITNSAELDEQINELISQLNSPSFADRESAVASLVEIGGPAIGNLARTAIASSPESAWRIKSALEAIGTRGNENIFLQSIGILQLLYLNGSDSLSGKIGELRDRWRLEQKKTILTQLRRLGATIKDPFENQAFVNQGLGGFGQPILIDGFVLNGAGANVFQLNVDTEIITPDKSPGVKRGSRYANLDPAKTNEQIDEILLASLEENREKIFGQTPVTNPVAVTAGESVNAAELQMRMQLAALRRQNIVDLNGGINNDLTVTITDRWKGTVSDLQSLKNLDGLARIELVEFDPGVDQLRELAELKSVRAVKIAGDEISSADLSFLAQLSIAQLEFTQRSIDQKLLSTFAQSSSLGSLIFSQCKIRPQALLELSNCESLRTLFFNDMQIDSDIFSSLHQLENLNYVNLSICKFETQSYKRLTAARRDLQIVFTPQAFLGIRAVPGLNGVVECEVSQVVAGSGAEKGGIKIGDIIEKIDGQVVDTFDDLRLHIAQHKSGETIVVTLRRDGEPLELDIKLTRFDTNLE
jgi:hypothetical protein